MARRVIAKEVEKLICIQKQQTEILKSLSEILEARIPDSIYVSYSGVIPKGTTVIDFYAGTVKKPDKTIDELGDALRKYRKYRVMRSGYIYTDGDISYSLDGKDKIPLTKYNDELITFKEFKTIEIKATESTNIHVFASTNPTTFLRRNIKHPIEPDFGKLLIGRFSYIKLFAQSLSNAVSEPITTTELLTYPEPLPADVLGNDYFENTATATAGNTVSATVNKVFSSIIINAIKVAGIIPVIVGVYLELTQVDGTVAGSATLNSIDVIIKKYQISTGTTTNVASLSKTVNKSISGTATASATFSEVINLEISKSSALELDDDNILQLDVTLNFSATAGAGATTDTIATCRLLCGRGTDETHILLPIV